MDAGGRATQDAQAEERGPSGEVCCSAFLIRIRKTGLSDLTGIGERIARYLYYHFIINILRVFSGVPIPIIGVINPEN